MLCVRAHALRLCIGPNAFGNALAGGLAEAMTSSGSQSGGASGGPGGSDRSGLSDVIAKANATPERGAMNYTDYGYEQARPLAERLGLVSAPQMSIAPDGSPGSGRYLEFSTNLPETPLASELYQANATYHRGLADSVAANTNASAMGITDAQVDAAIALGETSGWDAASYAARVTGYKAWNFVTAGFVGRHDERIIANANGRLSDTNFWKATAIDGGVSVASMFVAGRVGGYVAGRVGSGYLGSAATGAAVGGAFDLTLQGGQNAIYLATSAQSGSLGFSGREFAMATALGGALGVGGKYLSEYGDYRIEFATPEPGTLYSNPLPFKLVAPDTFNYGAYLRELVGPAPEGMIDPHAHHILFKEGNGAAQKVLVQEGQAILRRFDIDPILGVENLTWAPNRVVGQHGINALTNVVNRLKQVEQFGGSRTDMVETLKDLGQLAAQRK